MDERLKPIPENWQRAVAIAAHPDDLEYGASSAVAIWTAAGKQVVYVMATSGEAGVDAWPPEQTAPIREAEERESARLVGVETVEFLGFRDGVVEYGLPLRRALARMIRRYRPEVVITGNFDLAWPGGYLNQPDHCAVGLAVCAAVRDAGNRWIFRDLAAEGLEPWGGTRWIFVAASPEPTHAVDVGAGLERGIASLQAHRAYFEHLGQPFDADKFLREQTRRAGERAGCEYAVALQVIVV